MNYLVIKYIKMKYFGYIKCEECFGSGHLMDDPGHTLLGMPESPCPNCNYTGCIKLEGVFKGLRND